MLATFFFLLFAVYPAGAMETDQFACRQTERLDVSEPLNHYMNERIEAARLATEKEATSEWTYKKMAAKFRQNVRDQFEGHAQAFNAVLHVETWMEDTLARTGYAPVPTFNGARFHLYDEYPNYLRRSPGMLPAAVFELADKLMGYSSARSFKVKNVFFGSDKVGHFLDQGYGLWKHSSLGRDDQKAIIYGTRTEVGVFGWDTIGVFSYADMAANFAGYQFYKRLVSEVDGFAHYGVRRSGGGFELVLQHSFDIAEYVTPDWDEGINTPAYTPGVESIVRDHVANHLCRMCWEHARWKDVAPVSGSPLIPHELYIDMKQVRSMPENELFQFDLRCSETVLKTCGTATDFRYGCEPRVDTPR